MGRGRGLNSQAPHRRPDSDAGHGSGSRGARLTRTAEGTRKPPRALCHSLRYNELPEISPPGLDAGHPRTRQWLRNITLGFPQPSAKRSAVRRGGLGDRCSSSPYVSFRILSADSSVAWLKPGSGGMRSCALGQSSEYWRA